MHPAIVVSTPLATHLKLSHKQSPSTKKEKEDMQRVSYASTIVSFKYAMVCTRPNIAYTTSIVSQFLSKPGREHWNVVKWIMRHLQGIANLKLCFKHNEPILVDYTNYDMAADVDSKKSTSSYLITFIGGAVAWQSRL